MPPFNHDSLIYTPTEYGTATAGYKQPTPQQLLAAAEPSGRAPKKQDQRPQSASTFPAPLVLPFDELSWDPDYEPQSLKSWMDEPYRNEVTDERRTLYVVPVPAVTKAVSYVDAWTKPNEEFNTDVIETPKADNVVEYLCAFYHGLPVKLLSKPRLQFVPWDNKSKSRPHRIGLNIGSSIISIRSRESKDKIFSGQLNLNDLLDAAMTILPKDAYALIMLVEHDLYEDEKDDFCCGRAYGGSRVSIASMARYNPALDETQKVEREHAWPASHCQAYVDAYCRAAREPPSRPRKKAKKAIAKSSSVLRGALDAWKSLPPPTTPSQFQSLWLSRLCKTASHELGHCFGMDHCVYYACVIQGTAGLSEDARQPPYPCPVDLAKVLTATGADEATWTQSMLKFCEKFSEDRMFVALSAWLKERLREIEGDES